MTAIATGRNAARLGVYPTISSMLLPIAAATIIYEGTAVMVPYTGTNAGYLVNGAASDDYVKVLGIAQATVDNSTGIAGAKSVEVVPCVFEMVNSATTDAITAAMIGQDCYLVDNQTVARTRGSTGKRPWAGRIVGLEDSKVWVEIGGTRSADGAYDLPLIAAADYSTTGQYLFHGVNSSGQTVLASAAGQDVVGVLQNAPTSGAIGIVRMFGETLVYGGGAVNPGVTVATTSGGKTKAAVASTANTGTGAITGSFAMGTALTLGALDALHKVFLTRMGAVPGTAS